MISTETSQKNPDLFLNANIEFIVKIKLLFLYLNTYLKPQDFCFLFSEEFLNMLI